MIDSSYHRSRFFSFARPEVGRVFQHDGLPQGIRDIAWKAQVRLCARYRRLVAVGKKTVVVTTAIAREMIGFIWAIARQVQLQSA